MLKEIKYFIKAYGFWIFTQKVNVETNKFAKFQKYVRHFGRISNTAKEPSINQFPGKNVIFFFFKIYDRRLKKLI